MGGRFVVAEPLLPRQPFELVDRDDSETPEGRSAGLLADATMAVSELPHRARDRIANGAAKTASQQSYLVAGHEPKLVAMRG